MQRRSQCWKRRTSSRPEQSTSRNVGTQTNVGARTTWEKRTMVGNANKVRREQGGIAMGTGTMWGSEQRGGKRTMWDGLQPVLPESPLHQLQEVLRCRRQPGCAG